LSVILSPDRFQEKLAIANIANIGKLRITSCPQGSRLA
jgi:hypothetical protein